MKLVYIASPYRGDVIRNTDYAKDCCEYALGEGVNVYCPHLFLPNFLSEDVADQRELALMLGKDMLRKCDELWVFGDTITEGMFTEIQFAKEHGIEVKRVIDIYHVSTQNQEPCLC